MQLNLDSAVWILAPNDAVVPDSPARRVREQAGRTQVQQLPCPNISWKRDALVAFSGELRDEGDDYASSPEGPDSHVAPVFDWRETPVRDRRYLGFGPQPL